MIKNLSDIETALGMKAGDFKAAYDAPEEKVIDIATLAIVPKADYEVMKKTDFATRLENAGTAALEIAIKKARTEKGLDFTGKTIDNLLDAATKKAIADAGIAPDKRIADITKDFEAMKTTYESEKKKLSEIETTYKTKESQRNFDNIILTSINTKKGDAKTTIDKEDIAVVFKSKNPYRISDAGGIEYLEANGDVKKNKQTLSPMTTDEIMGDFITPYISKTAGGSGGSDTPGQNTPGGYDAFVKEMEGKQINPGTVKFIDEMQIRLKAKTLKM